MSAEAYVRLGWTTRVTVALLGLINRLLGRWGEPAAGVVAGKLPRGWLPPHRGEVEATRNGFTWTLRLDDNLQWRMFTFGSYESATLRVVDDVLSKGGLVVDVGANIGAFTLPAARAVGSTGKVIAIEASPDTAEILRRHVARNSAKGVVTIVEAALGREAGSVEIRASSTATSGDLGTRSIYGEGPLVSEVEMKTGDELLAELGLGGIDLLKIDVEGAELDVLSGMESLFRDTPPQAVIVELVPSHQQRANCDPDEVRDRFTSWGYEGRGIRSRGLVDLDDMTAGNVLFTRKK